MALKYLVISAALIATSSCAYRATEKYNTIIETPSGKQVVPPANCPDWSGPSDGDYNNDYDSNFGCANITNYGAMVENPDDLITGRSTKLGNGATAARAVSNYESGNVGGGAAAAPAGGSSN